MTKNRCNLETVSDAELLEISGGDERTAAAFGIMVGLAFVAGAAGSGVALAGALVIGGILAIS
jgi:hypothetical protein